MQTDHRIRGHVAAAFTILVWSTTYVSTKVLLQDFSPAEILFFRFILAYLLLFLLSPRPLRPGSWREEMPFAAAGLCGVTLYFLFQNIGLTYTLASNAGLLVSVAALSTADLAFITGSRGILHRWFILGFFVSISGVFLISFNGSFILELNPLGDLFILLGALSWAFYSNILALLSKSGYTLIQRTRKIFFYGILLMLPALLLLDFKPDLSAFAQVENLANMLFLGLGASAFCFLTWSYAVSAIGSVKSTTYLYFSPVITIVFSFIMLREPITWASATGTVLIIAGLVLAEHKRGRRP